MLFETLIFLALTSLAVFVYSKRKQSLQLTFIQSYEFHPTIARKVQEKYPHLTDDKLELVFDGLRDYFYFCNQAKRRMVAMPSQIVDVAWHEFIIFTRSYHDFSKKAIGHFLHHTPTQAMKSPTQAQEGIKRAWRLACANENIDPSAPSRLPRLFAIDTMLGIEDGFNYTLNCKDGSTVGRKPRYCAGHIGCASGCGGDSSTGSDSGGFFDSFGGSSDGGSSCGGGCGGD